MAPGGVTINIAGEDPGATFVFVNEGAGNVTFQITAAEDASVRVFTQESEPISAMCKSICVLSTNFTT